MIDEAVEPTCTVCGVTEGAHCGVCYAILIEQTLIPGSHSLKHIDKVDATEDADGNIEHWICEECGHFFSDSTAAIELDSEQVLVKFEQAVSNYIVGDADGSGKVNAKDVTAVLKYMVGKAPANFVFEAADADSSGKINAKDVTAILKILARS